MGDDMVIHVNGPRKGNGFSGMKMKSSSSKSCSSVTKVCSAECLGLNGGSIKTCLDCFLNGNPLYVYDYNCNVVRWHIEEHDGRIKLPEEVVELAYNELRLNEFCAGYHLLGRNCEHFATFCKTGLAFSMQAILFKSWISAGAFNKIRSLKLGFLLFLEKRKINC